MKLIEDITKRLVTSDEDLPGKTIHLVLWTDAKLYMTFEDGSLMVAQASRGYGDSGELQLKRFVDGYADLPNWMDLGVVSPADYAAWQEERRIANQTAEEKRERVQYERLKAKFA